MLALGLGLWLGNRGGSGLPPLPPGFLFLVDDDGQYLVDDDGNFLIAEE